MTKYNVRQIALERIFRLFEIALKQEKKELQDRYVYLALKISTYNRVTIPAELKIQFCKKCKSFLKEGKNSVIRIDKKGWKITCSECKNTRKVGFPLDKSRSKGKKK